MRQKSENSYCAIKTQGRQLETSGQWDRESDDGLFTLSFWYDSTNQSTIATGSRQTTVTSEQPLILHFKAVHGEISNIAVPFVEILLMELNALVPNIGVLEPVNSLSPVSVR